MFIVPRNVHNSTEPYRLTSFAIDDSRSFIGFTNGNYWNGWDCPAFTKEVAFEVLSEFMGIGDQAWYSVKEDTFFVRFDGQEEIDPYKGFTILFEGNPITLYDIGAFGWCWEEEKE